MAWWRILPFKSERPNHGRNKARYASLRRCSAALPGLFLLSIVLAGAAANDPQYIFLNFASGYDQNSPDSIKDSLFTEPQRVVGVPGFVKRRLGVSFIFSYLNGPSDAMADTLQKILSMSRKHAMPVLIVLDGENWWGYRSDLWNWWDSKQPGYNPENRENVEWTGWGQQDAIKVGWRNWGNQIRVAPAPNLASPAFRSASKTQLSRLARIIRQWAETLPPQERHLFPGVKIGWEASIGVNAFYYPNGNELFEKHPSDNLADPKSGLDMNKDFCGGLVPLGYAALTSKGWQHVGPVTLADHERITADYLGFLARLCREAGLRREQIFTHAGGQYAPWEKHYNHSVAINDDSLPGWSLYGLFPEQAGRLGESLSQAGLETWAASEWWPNAKSAAEWREALDRTLAFKQCRFISIYNWESLRDSPAAVEGLRGALEGRPVGKGSAETPDL